MSTQGHSAGISRRGLLQSAALAAVAGLTTIGTTGAALTPTPQRARGRRSDRATLVLLGTAGGPGLYGERSGIASAVAIGDAFYLIDLGHGALGRVAEAGLSRSTVPGNRSLDGLSGVFLTHLHSDHVAEYASLLINGMWNGLDAGAAAIPVYGPGDRGGLPPVLGNRLDPDIIAPEAPTPGTVGMTEQIVQAFAADLNERMRGSGGTDPRRTFDVHDIALPSGVTAPIDHSPMPRIRPFQVHEDDWVRVTATLVEHSPVFPAFAFRFDTDDGSVTFSGDTAPSENLIELAADTDVLVHEVIDSAWVESLFPAPRTPEAEATMRHLIDAHTTIEDVGGVAESAGAAKLVLNHILPLDNPMGRWRRAADGFSGKLVVGSDLDQITIGR